MVLRCEINLPMHVGENTTTTNGIEKEEYGPLIYEYVSRLVHFTLLLSIMQRGDSLVVFRDDVNHI